VRLGWQLMRIPIIQPIHNRKFKVQTSLKKRTTPSRIFTIFTWSELSLSIVTSGICWCDTRTSMRTKWHSMPQEAQQQSWNRSSMQKQQQQNEIKKQ